MNVLDYWRHPEASNAPERYLAVGHERSEFLVGLMRRYAKPHYSILELGCNAGRNLEHLRKAGFTNLSGIEVSGQAVDAMSPELARVAEIRVDSIETALPLADPVDVVFTMAVLQHLPIYSEWVFAQIAGTASRLLITIEDELSRTRRHFPRDYGKVFTGLGLTQIHEQRQLPELEAAFVARVFRP